MVHTGYMGVRGEDTETVSIRFPIDLYLLVKKNAADDTRSISQQVIHYVKQYLISTQEYKSLKETEREEGRATSTEESEGGAASNILG